MGKREQTKTQDGPGLFAAPVEPSDDQRLKIDPKASPATFSCTIIKAALGYALAGASLLIVFNVAVSLLPVALGAFVDAVIAPLSAGVPLSQLWGALALWLGALAGLYLVINLGYRFGGRLGWFGMQRARYELSQQVLARVLDPRGISGPGRLPGELLSLATADVHRACLVLWVVVYPPGEVIGLAVAVGVLFAVHPLLGLGVLIGLPIVLVIMGLLARPLRQRAMAELAGLADAAASAADFVAGYRIIRGLHSQGVAARRYRGVSREALRATLAARDARAAFRGIGAAMAHLFAALISCSAALLAYAGEITPGALVAAAGVAVILVGPVNTLIGTLGSFWAISQASAKRLLALLSAPFQEAALGSDQVLANPGDLPELAIFSTSGSGSPPELQLEINPGEFVLLDLGQGAADTLAGALSLTRPPPAGCRIEVRGKAISDYAPTALRDELLVSPHRSELFAGTVLDNVQTNSGSGAESAAKAALASAQLQANELVSGYLSEAGEDGSRLSGGQRQRLALARALAADPAILMLIEPTTSVDAVTEQRIATNLATARAGKTTIVITGSAAFGAVADRVLHLREGTFSDD